MKPYFAFLAILTCYGCSTQQPQPITTKTITPPTPVKTDSHPSSADRPLETKVDSIKTPVPVKTDAHQLSPIIPLESRSDSIKTPAPVKTDAHQLSPVIPLESRNDSIKTPAPVLRPTIPTPDTTKNTIKPKKIVQSTVLKPQPILSKKNIKKTPSLPPTSSHVEKTESTAVTVSKTSEQPKKQPGFEFNLEQLPLYFGSTWILDRKKDSVSNTTRCLLNSKVQKFNDGYSEAKISLQLSTDSLLIKTSSNIDMSYPEIGIYIDQNTALPLEKLFGESSILIEKNTDKITRQLRQGEKLTVKLGFWPTWTKTETRSISFSLINFDKIYQAFIACEKL